jgi:hypothetical protein
VFPAIKGSKVKEVGYRRLLRVIMRSIAKDHSPQELVHRYCVIVIPIELYNLRRIDVTAAEKISHHIKRQPDIASCYIVDTGDQVRVLVQRI